MPDVWIPPQMQRITGAPDRVQVAGATVRQVINNLERLHPGIKELLYDEELDDITPGLAVIVDGDVSQLGLLERVGEDSEMHFLPAIGGGRGEGPAEPAGVPAKKKRPETLADFRQEANLIGILDSREFGPEGASMSVDTGKKFTDILWEKYQREQKEARQRYGKEPAQGKQEPERP